MNFNSYCGGSIENQFNRKEVWADQLSDKLKDTF